MTKFKVGDEVRIVRPNPAVTSTEDEVGKTFIIGRDAGDYHGSQSWSGIGTQWRWKEEWLELASVSTPIPLYSEEQAVSFLKEKGYSITPPPEPLKGKAAIYVSGYDGGTRVIDKNHWDKVTSKAAYKHKLIAIVDWTEGNGLPNKE